MEPNMSETKLREEKISEMIQKGEELIYPEKMENWKKWVTTRVNDRSDNGLSIETSLKIMQQLADGASLEDVLTEYYQLIENLSVEEKFDMKDYALGYVGKIMFNFGEGEKGPEFFKRNFVHEFGPDVINEKMQEKINKQIEENRRMAEAQKEDSQKENNNLEEPKKDMPTKSKEEKISEMIQKGEELIYPEKMENWKKWVTTRVNDRSDNGLSIETSLEIMQKLADGASLEDVLTEYYQLMENLSVEEKFDMKDYALGYVGKIMFNFGEGEKGPEFFKRNFVHEFGPDVINEKMQEKINKQIEENKRMAEAQKEDRECLDMSLVIKNAVKSGVIISDVDKGRIAEQRTRSENNKEIEGEEYND